MVTDALDTVLAALAAGGIDATVEPPEVNPPSAWIAARRLDTETLGCRWRVVVDVYLIVPDTGIRYALDTLDGLLARALDALDAADLEIDGTDLDQSVTLPTGGGQLPAYRIGVISES